MADEFESWADGILTVQGKWMNKIEKWGVREAIIARLRHAYEAGEIAMKEKAAQLCESFYGRCAIATPEKFASHVRALPLSGAEESKK